MDKVVLMKNMTVAALFATITTNLLSASPFGMTRSEEVIANVRTVKDAAACAETLRLVHADCQYDRCTQKCFECRKWDVRFFDAAAFHVDLVRTCAICGEGLKFTSGFGK